MLDEGAILAVAAVLIIVAVSLLAPRVGVAAPILLVVVGLIGSFIPGIPQVAISPEWILVIVLPEAPLVRSGPYRILHHPNYVAVVAEGIALPLVHTAWLTAICFTVANAALLTVRIRVENAALGYTHGRV